VGVDLSGAPLARTIVLLMVAVVMVVVAMVPGEQRHELS
jgi:hypothetical protein